MKKRNLLLLAWLLVAAPLFAADGIREERVHFKAGTEGATVKGRLQGRDSIDYLLNAQAGQQMSVTLHTDNPQNYFNILPPGNNDEALFIGSSSGNRFDDRLPASGDYRIRVYLMRAAARRDEAANYRLDIRIHGTANASSAAPDGDFADGLSGGPDFWEVTGVARDDTLNLRADHSAHARVVDELDNGARLRNLGCKMVDGQRWCQVAQTEGSRTRGWVAGRYLRESSE